MSYHFEFNYHILRQQPPQVLHIILIPFTTAFYNIFALVGLFPVLEVSEKKTFHHLR